MSHRQIQSQYVHALYFPSWRVYRGATPGSMDCIRATHVIYAFALVDDEGRLYHQDEYADLQIDADGFSGCIQAVLQLRTRFPHLKVLLSVGGGSGSGAFSIFSSTEHGRHTFAGSVTDFVERFGFDGIHIDWEHPSTPEQGRNYVSVLQTIRTYLPEALIFSALPAGEWCLRNINMKQASEYLDQISLMCYDFVGPWSTESGHHAQLYAASFEDDPDGASSSQLSANAALENLSSCNITPEKILIGIPVYGRSFLGANGAGQQFTSCAGEEGVLDYRNLPPDEAQEVEDLELVAASCYSSATGFVTYDTTATVAAKAQYVKDRGLGGLFYWTGVTDSDIESRSLVAAGYNILFDE